VTVTIQQQPGSGLSLLLADHNHISIISCFSKSKRVVNSSMKISFRKFVKVGILALLLCSVLASVQVLTVKADVPDIVSVVSRNLGSVTWLDITVRHGAFSSLHYVTRVELEINGTTQNLVQSSQSTETFTVSYSLGSTSNTYSVRARALCNIHGYSAYSNSMTVPEFSLLAGVTFLIFATIAVVFSKKTLSRRASTRDHLKSSPL